MGSNSYIIIYYRHNNEAYYCNVEVVAQVAYRDKTIGKRGQGSECGLKDTTHNWSVQEISSKTDSVENITYYVILH